MDCVICGEPTPTTVRRERKTCSPTCLSEARARANRGERKDRPPCAICGKTVPALGRKTCSHECFFVACSRGSKRGHEIRRRENYPRKNGIGERWIPVEPMRERVERFLAERGSVSTICHRLGWTTAKGYADTSKLTRVVGLQDRTARNGHCRNAHMSRENAERVSEALGLDPVDVGL